MQRDLEMVQGKIGMVESVSICSILLRIYLHLYQQGLWNLVERGRQLERFCPKDPRS